MASPAEPRRVKPQVALIYSDPDRHTVESSHFAHYMGASLYLGRYARIHLVRFSAEKKEHTHGDRSKIKVIPHGQSQIQVVKEGSEFHLNQPFSIVNECQIVIICVVPPETEKCAQQLAKTLKKNENTGIFTFQQGCKNYSSIEPCFKETGNITFDGSVGLQVVEDPSTGALKCLTSGGKLVVERLSREKVEWGNKYVNLLQTSEIPMLFRKAMTPYTWGSLISHLYGATNALTGGTIREHLGDRRNRLVVAQMIRECLQALKAAAKDGKWEPDNAAACDVSLANLEFLLCLPNVLFGLVAMFFLKFAPGVGSPMQADLQARRRTALSWTLADMCTVGDRYQVHMGACKTIHKRVLDAINDGNGVPSMDPGVLYNSIGSPTASTKALWNFLLFRLGLLALIIVAFVLMDVLIPRQGL